jgi:hypothetical protein
MITHQESDKKEPQKTQDSVFIDLGIMELFCVFFGGSVCIYHDFCRTFLLFLSMTMVLSVLAKWAWTIYQHNIRDWIESRPSLPLEETKKKPIRYDAPPMQFSNSSISMLTDPDNVDVHTTGPNNRNAYPGIRASTMRLRPPHDANSQATSTVTLSNITI